MTDRIKLPAMLLLLFISIGFGNAQQATVEKSEITEVIDGRTYFIHFVKKGQSLEAIADVYEVSIKGIQNANKGLGNKVQANQILKVPAKEMHSNTADHKGFTETKQKQQPASDLSQERSSKAGQQKIHLVQKKETYYGISRQYGVSVEELKEANPEAGVLQPGQELIIPSEDTENRKAVNRTDPETSSAATVTYITHKVKKGETMYRLSKNFNVSMNELVKANPELVEGLKAGQLIRIPQNNSGEKNANGEASKQTVPQDDKEYHWVKEGESLYDISRKYDVTSDLLIEKNSFLQMGVEPGQRIFIPDVEDLNDTLEQISHDKVLRTLEHRVKRKESLYDISKEYRVSVERIFALNPDLKYGLERRMKLDIPVKVKRNARASGNESNYRNEQDERAVTPKKKLRQEEEKISETEKRQREYCRSFQGDDFTYNVTLMLPFYLSEVDSIKAMGSDEMQPASEYKSFRFIQFYEGVRLALDTLQQQGLKVRLFVYDVDEDVQKTRETLSRPELQYMDLIIGPLYKNSFSLVSDYAQNHDIKIVNPLTTREEILSNEKVFKVQPSFKGQLSQLAKFVNMRYPDANIVLVRQNKYTGEEEIQYLENEFKKRMDNYVYVDGLELTRTLRAKSFMQESFHERGLVDGIYVEDRFYDRSTIEDAVWDSLRIPNTVKQIAIASDSTLALEQKGSIARKNIFIALADDKAFVLDLITRLNVLRDTMDITLVGMPSWKEFDLEYEYLMNLDLHLFGPDFIQYTHPDTEAFIRKFRKKYNTEPDPSQYAYIGYDITDFFMRALMQFGADFEDCLPYVKAKPLQMRFDFKKTSSGAFENTGTNIFHYDDYERIDLTPIIQTN